MPLPDPGLPIHDLRERPLDVSGGGGGGEDSPAVIARYRGTERRQEREVTIPLDELTAAELADLLAVWNSGAGVAAPFEFTVPGEVNSRLWLFRDPDLQIEFGNAVRSGTEITLIDVTPPDGP